MASRSITMNGNELKKQAKLEGLDRECLRLKSPFSDDKRPSYCNSVFKPTTNYSSGSSGPGALTYVAMGATLLAGVAPIAVMALASGGSQGPQGAQGAGQLNSKAVLTTLSNAEDSGDEKTIRTAIAEGNRVSKGYEGQINAAQAELEASKKDIPAIEGNVNNQKNTVIPDLKKGLDDLKGQVKGKNSSSGLTSSRDSEINSIPKNGSDGKPDPQYQTKVDAVKAKYQPQIDKAKDIEENKIPAKEKEIKEAEEKLKDLEQQLEKAKEKAEKAQENLDKLKPEKQKIDEKVARLERQLATIQSSTKTDGATAPAATDTPPPVAAATRTSEELGKDLLKDLNSDSTTPAATPTDGSKIDKPDSSLGADTPSVKKETPEDVSFTISNSRTTAELDILDGEIDTKFGKGSPDSIRLHNEVNNKKLSLKGAGDEIIGSGL